MLDLNIQSSNYSIQLSEQTLRIQGGSGDDTIRVERGQESTAPGKIAHDIYTDYVFVTINNEVQLPIHVGHSNHSNQLLEIQVDGGDGHDTIDIDVTAVAGKQPIYEPNVVVFDDPTLNTINIEGGNHLEVDGEELSPNNILWPFFQDVLFF